MNLKAPFAVMFLIMTALVACQKEDLPPAVSTNLAQLSVINLTPDQINIFQNGSRINNNTTIYPLGATNYYQVLAGEQQYQFKINGSSKVLFNVNLTLDSLGSYSLFAVAQAPDGMILVNDDIAVDTGNVTMIRFVNASPEPSNLNVWLNDTLRFEDKAYKSVSDIIPVTPGEKIVKITRAGSTSALVTDTIEFRRGQAYTLFSKGLAGQTGNSAFGLGVVIN